MPLLEVNLESYQSALRELTFGKTLPDAIYIHWDSSYPIPALLNKITSELKADFDPKNEFNVIKFQRKQLKLSLLCYPDFSSHAHPCLSHSISIDLASNKQRKSNFKERLNPPILHRKETFIPADHPDYYKFKKLTEQEQDAGLYKNTSTIGFLENWNQLLADKGLAIKGHQLTQREPSNPATETTQTIRVPTDGPEIYRHKTAISRPDLSKPVKTLLDYGQLDLTSSFFDYGCGLGDDIGGLTELGYSARGWDPHFAPHREIVPSDVVNLGFILNVIEDAKERVEVLTQAWNITEKLLVVSVLVAGQETYTSVKPFRDGVITNKNTFQKHFEQDEFIALVETALGADPVPVGLGICYVFRDVADQQDFISQRTKRAINWEKVNQRLRALRPKRLKLAVYDRDPELLDDYWRRVIDLGRTPRPDEYDRSDEIRSLCGSVNKATDLFVDKYGPELLEAAHRSRREDLLVYLAAGEFQKRRTPQTQLSKHLRTDLKVFFGSYAAACDEARCLLFSAGDSDIIEEMVSDLEFGWFDAAEGHFTIHRSLISHLPPVLRMYIEAGARLFGDPSEADLIKIHAYSGKLTFLHYEKFETEWTPILLMRIKIDLRRQFTNVFDYQRSEKQQVLFFKERFLGSDFPDRQKMENYSTRLRKLGINESMLGSNDRFAPNLSDFSEAVERLGLTKGLNPKRKG